MRAGAIAIWRLLTNKKWWAHDEPIFLHNRGYLLRWVPHGMPVYWRKSPHRWLQNDSPNGKILELRTGGVEMLEWVSMRVAIVFWADALEQRGYSVKYTKCGAQ